MRDPYPLHPISDDEFETWARTIANTYGEDRRDADLENERSIIELDRTIAAFDGNSPVAGAAIYTRSMTIPGAVQPIAAVTWVGVSPTHRRRGILTSMMRKQLTDLHESGGEPIAALNASEATIYDRFGYGIASRAVQFEGEKRSMRFRSDIDVSQDTFCPWNAGCYRLQADGDSVTCERTQASGDMQLSSTELGAVFLGGTTLASLAAAGRVKELRPGAVASCTVAFRGEREPFYPPGAAFPAY
jgi:ribosomal protein S18 acetylase RimI-like enzyme